MSEYKGIKGLTIQEVASDPPAPIEGQVWYNTSTSALKGYINDPGTWSTGANLNNQFVSRTGFGTSQTAAVSAGGIYSGSNAETEVWNGTSWTEVNDLNTARNSAQGIGTSTAGLIAGGEGPPGYILTESWNGTNWTEVNDLNTVRGDIAGAGAGITNTAGIVFGGGFSGVTQTELWNGTNWTEVNDLNNAKTGHGGTGTSTAALKVGGERGTGPDALVESWNGTNWTEVNDVNTNKVGTCATGNNNTSVLAFGSESDLYGTELWNGTNWSVGKDLNVIAEVAGGAGTSTATIAFAGQSPAGLPTYNASEEWNAGISTKTFSTG